MPGAAILCVRAAARAGAGLVTLAIFARDTLVAVAPAAPETIFLDLSSAPGDAPARQASVIAAHEHDSRVVGPGLGRTERSRGVVRALLADAFPGPLVLDADALNVLAPRVELVRERRAACVLTPHPGEAARLLGRPVPRDEAGRIAAAQEIARRSGALCVLKGMGSVVTDGERVHVNATGNPGMATGGTGDVLTGIIAALVGQALPIFDAAQLGVYLHGLAGDLARDQIGEVSMIATDLLDYLPTAFRRLHS